ncbi:MAG: aspartyl protease family protein [Bacillota bacterium]|nr:aspartyl protease family protein [Bacillota bacterium]
MVIQFCNGLLFTSIQVTFRGASKVINNIVIDTGAAETIISPDVVEEIGVIAELEDNISSFYGIGGSLQNFFSKRVDQINFYGIILKDLKIDFGIIDLEGNINGLLGFDLLMKVGAVIDLEKLTLTVRNL